MRSAGSVPARFEGYVATADAHWKGQKRFISQTRHETASEKSDEGGDRTG
jgi:hypothetical protein